MDKEAIRGKRKARKLALQALYQWLMSAGEPSDIEAQFRAANNMAKVDGEYFRELLYGVVKHVQELEEQFNPFLDREIQSLNPIELTALRLGVYELYHCPEIPFRVVLDESISLTKEFGSQDGYRYVNGVLNQVAKKARLVEINLNNE